MLCKQVRLTNRAPIAACPASGRRTAARAEGDNSTKQQNVPDEINDAAKDDMKYELREDMSNLRTTAINHPDTLGEAVDDTLGPRVRELRAKKLAQGTGDIGAAFARAFMALLGVCRPETLMRFDGPAPELINGRLAMFGFVAAVGAEIATHQDIFTQFKEAPVPILAGSALIAVASFIPMVRGTKLFDDGAGEGIKPFHFNVTNELINGRAAMLGLALLIIFEAGGKTSLF